MLSALMRCGRDEARFCSCLSLFFFHADGNELEKPSERLLATFNKESMSVSNDQDVSFILSSMS